MYQYIDRSYQLAPRFNEDELIKLVKDLGYCGTLSKAALVSIGALHSTPQIVGLLSWLADFVRIITMYPEPASIEKAELNVMIDSYNAWCVEAPYDLAGELRALYSKRHANPYEQLERSNLYASYIFVVVVTVEMHGLEDGVLASLDNEIAATLEQCKILESKSSQIEASGFYTLLRTSNSKQLTEKPNFLLLGLAKREEISG